MKISVEYFGPAKKYTRGRGADYFQFSQEKVCLAEVFDRLACSEAIDENAHFVDFIVKSCGIVVNEEYVDIDREGDVGKNVWLSDNDEVIIIPPVSSG